MSLLHQVALTFLNNIGPVNAKALVAYFGGAEQVFATPASKWLKVSGIGAKKVNNLNIKEALLQAEKELDFARKNDVQIIFYTDSVYPKKLKQCSDSPLLLYGKGNFDLNMPHVVSVVGTRNATDYGKKLCNELIEELSDYNVLVISGLAYGIDVLAHKCALAANLPTIGVVGHGLDRMYPAQNSAIAKKMEQNGGVLTEYPSGTQPNRENFPARNRIVAGMADATIVVEAGLNGGALITAEIANSYNREVFAFPGRIGDEYSEGCNFLIRHNKAILLHHPSEFPCMMGWHKKELYVEEKVGITIPDNLTEQEKNIINLLSTEKAIDIDALQQRSNLASGNLAMLLLNLELQGYVRQLPGKAYKLSLR